MSNKKGQMDEFRMHVGEYLGVPPESISIHPKLINGIIHLWGPKPTKVFDFPDSICPPFPYPPLPPKYPDMEEEGHLCITIVLKIPPPAKYCEMLKKEYEDLLASLQDLIESEQWDEVALVVMRLGELRNAMKSACEPRKGKDIVYRYCIG